MAKKQRNRQRSKQINSLIAPLTPKGLRQEVRARTRLQYGELGRALRGDLRASRAQSQNLNAWYNEYQREMDKLRSGQLANTQALQGQMASNAGAVSQAGAATRDALQSEEDRSAAIRGTVSTGENTSRDAAGAAQRSALAASSRDAAAQMGASSNNLLTGIAAAAELGRQADQRAERNTRLQTQSKLRDLKREKGDFRVKTRGDLRQSERDWTIQNRTLAQKDRYSNAMITQAQLGLAGKQASAGATLGAAQLYSGAKVQSAKIYARGQNGQAIRGSDISAGLSTLRVYIRDGQVKPQTIVNSRRNQNFVKDVLVKDGNLDPRLARIVVNRYVAQLRKRGGRSGRGLGTSASGSGSAKAG